MSLVQRRYDETSHDHCERCGPCLCFHPPVACCPSGYRPNQEGSCACQSAATILSICDAGAVPGTGAERDGHRDETGWESHYPGVGHCAYPFPRGAGRTDTSDHSSARDLRRFCRTFSFTTLCGMLSPCSPRYTTREREDGDQLPGRPWPTGHHAHGGVVVRGLSLALAAWGSTPGGARRTGRPRDPPALGGARQSPGGKGVASPDVSGVGQLAPGRALQARQRPVVLSL